MKKRILAIVLSSLMAFAPATAYAAQTAKTDARSEEADVLEEGIYVVDFDTDSGMFHANEANEGKGLLTVNEKEMILHVSLASKNIVNLFQGSAEDAKKEDAKILQPTTDTVTYSDGYSEEVYGFDIPVPYLNEEFDLALIGKKEKWYDHKVKVVNPVKVGELSDADTEEDLLADYLKNAAK